MVRKATFTRDDVVRAALSVVEQTSLDALSARRVADEMGASTAPVYSNFASMEALKAELKETIAAQLLECTHIRSTENEFLNMGLGVLEFARSHPGLYCAIFMASAAEDTVARRVMADMLGRMARVPELAPLPAVERLILLRKMAIFTHGLAAQLCAGLAESYSWEELELLLAEVGHAMVLDAVGRGERSAEEIALLGTLCDGTTLTESGNDIIGKGDME